MAKKSKALHPAIPAFTSEFLGHIARALSARAKAIRYKRRSFKCAREEDENGDEMMVLYLTETTLKKRDVRLNFSFWSDGGFYIGVHVSPGKNKTWEYGVRANGDLLGFDPVVVVERFESTVGEAIYESFQNEAQRKMRSLWKGVELEFFS